MMTESSCAFGRMTIVLLFWGNFLHYTECGVLNSGHELGELKKAIDGIEAMIHGVVSKVDRIDRNVKGVDKKVDGVERKVDGLYEYIFGAEKYEALISGKMYYVQDGGLTASTSYDSHHGPECSRLGAVKPPSCHTHPAWHSTKADTKPWIQVDLGRTFDIHAVATQGRKHPSLNQWVLTYHVASLHMSKFLYYLDQRLGGIKLFRGNFDQETVINNPFVPLIRTRVLRLYPVTWHDWCAIHWELYGQLAL